MSRSLEVNVRIRGWGRIKKATGTTDVRTRDAMAVMIRLLGKRRRFDLLESIRDGAMSVGYVYAQFEADRLEQLPVGPALLPLITTIEAWLESHEASDHHRANEWSGWRKLERHATAGTRLADLPRLLEKVRGECVEAKTPASFNRARAMASAFLRQTVKRRHQLYQDLRDVAPMLERREKGSPQTIAQIAALATKLGELGPMWWALCLTGMRPREYFQLPWRVGTDRVVITNAKTTGERLVPMVETPAEPSRVQAIFAKWVRKKSGERVSAYDARRTFAVLCEQVRIPKSRIDLYLGHGPKSMTDLYTWHDVADYLAADAAALRTFRDAELAKVAGTIDGTMARGA